MRTLSLIETFAIDCFRSIQKSEKNKIVSQQNEQNTNGSTVNFS